MVNSNGAASVETDEVMLRLGVEEGHHEEDGLSVVL